MNNTAMYETVVIFPKFSIVGPSKVYKRQIAEIGARSSQFLYTSLTTVHRLTRYSQEVYLDNSSATDDCCCDSEIIYLYI